MCSLMEEAVPTFAVSKRGREVEEKVGYLNNVQKWVWGRASASALLCNHQEDMNKERRVYMTS